MDSATQIINPLPWPWFDFDERPRLLDPAVPSPLPTIDDAGHSRVYAVTADERRVPFKFFRKKSTPDSPRPLLILLHGMGLTIATFRGVSGYLFLTHDLALVDYSSLSCKPAESGWPRGGMPIRALADAVWLIADAIGAQSFNVAGNSLGGGMCVVAALHPQGKSRIQKVLLSNPACYPQSLPTMYRLARIPLFGELLMTITRPEKLIGGVEYIGYVDKARFDADLRQRYLRTMSHRHNRFRLMDMIRHLPANASDTTPAIHLSRLNEIKQPVLLTWGEQDPLLAEGAGIRLARDLPHCIYEPHADLTHMPHEEAPDRIGPRWAEFLNKN